MMMFLAGLAAGVTALQPVHDVYAPLRSPTGQLCCGGDPRTGDCEPVSYRLGSGGDVEIYSSRYGATVRVSREKIIWSSVPGSGDGAHWCGRPRVPDRHDRALMLGPDNPDPGFVTLCAYIDPGGS